MRRTLLGGLAGAALAVTGAAVHADILIGGVGPLTGAYANIGEQMQRGAETAVADLNAAGGVLDQQLKIIFLDDACDASQAVAAAQKLVATKVPFVAGHYCSGASIPAAKVYEEAGIIQISPASTNPRLTEEGRANVFRTCGRDDQQGKEAGDYLADRWPDAKIAILHDGSVFGKGIADETRKRLEKRGVQETLYEALTPGQTDYFALLEKVRTAAARVLYYGGYHTEAALLIRGARESGYNLQLVGGDALSTDSFWQIAGKAGEGTLFTFFPDARNNAVAKPVVERFHKQGFEPDGYTLYTYAAVQVWAQAAAKAGSVETKAVITALRTNEFDTVLGRISFDAKGDLTQPAFVWYIWQDGKYMVHERLTRVK
jgi:branched-chain amino acid transport system substrate-binding protein